MMNTIVLMITHHKSSETFNTTMVIFNIIFVVFFLCECILKMIGYGF